MIFTAEEFGNNESYWAVEELYETVCRGLINLFMNLDASYAENGELEFYKIGDYLGCKVYCSGTLVREFADYETNVICYFENSFSIPQKRMKRVHEALKEILTKDGKEPEDSWMQEEMFSQMANDIAAEIDKEIIAEITKQAEAISDIIKVPENLMKETSILTAENCEDIRRLMKQMGISSDF